jgi:broad specificity phosphatase PhoE
MKLKILIYFCAGIIFSSSVFAIPARILIIRHAEKSTDSNDINLSAKGYRRAEALKHLFKVHPEYASKGLPAAVFAAKYIPGKNSKRSIQTAAPLSNSLGLNVETPYKGSDFSKLAELILKSKSLSNKVIFISWVHGNIPKLATALRGNCPQDWDGDQVFDRVWVIDNSNAEARCSDLPQSLLPDDSP